MNMRLKKQYMELLKKSLDIQDKQEALSDYKFEPLPQHLEKWREIQLQKMAIFEELEALGITL